MPIHRWLRLLPWRYSLFQHLGPAWGMGQAYSSSQKIFSGREWQVFTAEVIRMQGRWALRRCRQGADSVCCTQILWIFFQATCSISRDVAISKNKFTSSEFSLLPSRNGQNRAVQKTISHLLQLSDEGTQSGLEFLHDLIQNHRSASQKWVMSLDQGSSTVLFLLPNHTLAQLFPRCMASTRPPQLCGLLISPVLG